MAPLESPLTVDGLPNSLQSVFAKTAELVTSAGVLNDNRSSLESQSIASLPADVQERLPLARAHAQRMVDQVAARQAKEQPRWALRLTALQRSQRNVEHRLHELRDLTVDATREISKSAACRKGCNHCCHIPVALTMSEARLIGKRIGIKPEELEAGTVNTEREYGEDLPCPFLVQGECAIYAHRPLACQWHFNLDKDALLCQLIPGQSVPVFLANMRPYQEVYVRMCGNDALADIRKFFPPDRVRAFAKKLSKPAGGASA